MKEGWKYSTLGECGTFTRGGNFLKSDFIEDGVPCVHYGQIHTRFGLSIDNHLTCIPAEKAKKMASKGDLLIAITSEDVEGSCKCTAWLGDYDVAMGGHSAIYKHSFDPKFISYYFRCPAFYREKAKYTHGFKVVEIKPSDIAKIPVPVPPLPEQQRIVAHLDSSFAKIDALKANAEKMVEEAKALFASALREAMTPKEGWEEKTLGEITEVKDGTHESPKYVSEGIPFVTQKNITSNGFDLTNTKKITLEDHNRFYARSNVEFGDIIFSMIGANRGMCCIVNCQETFSIKNVGLIKKGEKAEQMFLLYYLLSPFASIYVQNNSNGGAQEFIGLKGLRNFPIPLPPLPDQRRIVSHLDDLSAKVRQLEANFKKVSEECDALKQSILRETFE